MSGYMTDCANNATTPEGKRTSQGAIAQLGGRLLCTQEVVGSIPSGSTIIFRPLLFDESSITRTFLLIEDFLLFNNLDISDVLNGFVTQDFSRLARRLASERRECTYEYMTK